MSGSPLFNQICLTCRNNLQGLVDETARRILCDFCNEGSNYDELRSDDLERVQEFNKKKVIPKKRNNVQLEPITAPIY